MIGAMSATLLFTEDLSAARLEIDRAGGRVLHVLTPSVVVAELPQGAALSTCTTARPADLDPASARLADAWDASARAISPGEGLPWDSPGKEPP
jgi:hypothetical protein